jgi:hypothetical protein
LKFFNQNEVLLGVGTVSIDHYEITQPAKQIIAGRLKKMWFYCYNIPRRYASMINKMGIKALKELSPEALALGPDLEKYFDPTAKAYAEMATKMGRHIPQNMLNMQTAF